MDYFSILMHIILLAVLKQGIVFEAIITKSLTHAAKAAMAAPQSPAPQVQLGKGFLADLCHDWEAAADGAAELGARGVTNFDTAHLRVLVKNGIEIASNQVCFSLLDRRAAGEKHRQPRRQGLYLQTKLRPRESLHPAGGQLG